MADGWRDFFVAVSAQKKERRKAMSKNEFALAVIRDLRSLADSLAAWADAAAAVDQAAAPEQPTLEAVRAALAEKNQAGHREAVKAIIYKYGAKNLTALDPKHYSAVLQEVLLVC